MTEAKKVPSYADRAIGAIIGAAVADAACQPVHWIYNLEKLDSLLAKTPNLEFRPESANPFYTRETGQQSCYGDQAFVLLESLVECKGLNVKDFTERSYAFFGPGSEYDTPINSLHRTKGGPRPKLPVNGPWRQGSIKEFLKNIEEGETPTGSKVDKQMDCIAKLAPLVALYAGKEELLTKVEDAVRVTQNVDMCVALALAAARFLEYCILNGPDTDMFNDIIAEIRKPNRNNPQDLDRVITGYLEKVKINIERPHREVVTGVFVNS
eukprot:gi/632940757/ref/XP_007885488.1/ PREDICTED: crystallin J1B-like [Callorhinchus milii]